MQAGRGLESRSVLSLCATTHAAEGRSTRVTLLATSVIAYTFDFFRSWTHIDKLVRRDKVLYDVSRRVFNAHRDPHPREGVCSDVLSVSLSSVLKVPNDGSQLRVGHVSLSSHLEQYSYKSQPGSGLHDKKNSNYDHPWPSGRTRIPSLPGQFDALDRSKVPTCTHHTRFTPLGWARVCGWGANDETATSTDEGESTVTGETRNTGFPTTVHARDVSFCRTGLAFFFISKINLRLLSMLPATDSDGLDYQKACNRWFSLPAQNMRMDRAQSGQSVQRMAKEKQPPLSSHRQPSPPEFMHSAPQVRVPRSFHGRNIRLSSHYRLVRFQCECW